MNLSDFFNKVGGDYDLVSSRLPSDALIKKFVLKFPADPSYSQLKNALEEEDSEKAFLAAHTLKGTAANLGLDFLAKAASELTEQLRGASSLPKSLSTEQVDSAYKLTIESITMID